MNPLKYAQMMKYLTRAKKADPSLPDVFPASKAPIPAKTKNVQETEAVNQFMLRNPRKDMANGGSLKFYPKASGSISGKSEIAPGIDVNTRDINYGGTVMYEGDKFYSGVSLDKGKVKFDVTDTEGNTLFKDTLSKDDAVNFIVGLGDPKGEKFQIKTDKDFNNMQVVFRKSFAGGGMLVQPGFGGTRQGYSGDSLSTKQFAAKQNIYGTEGLRKLVGPASKELPAYKVFTQALKKAGINFTSSTGEGVPAKFENVNNETIKKFETEVSKLKAKADLPMSRVETENIKKQIKIFVKDKIAKGEYVSRPIIKQQFGIEGKAADSLITRSLGINEKAGTGLLKKLGKEEKAEIVRETGRKAALAKLGESDEVLKVINDEFKFDPNISDSEELAKKIYGDEFTKANKKKQLDLILQTDNDVFKYLRLIRGSRGQIPKGLKLPSQEKINDLIDHIETGLEDEAGEGRQAFKKKGFRFSPGLIRDYKFALVDEKLGLESNTFRTERNKFVTKGKNLDEVFGLSSSSKYAPGYAEAVQSISPRANAAKETQIDLPLSRILRALNEGRTTMTYKGKKNVSINEAVEDFNKTSKAFAKKYNIRGPKINLGGNFDLKNYINFRPESQKNIEQVFKDKKYFLSEVRNKPFETITSKLAVTGSGRLKPPSGSGAVTLGALDVPSMFKRLSPGARKLVGGAGGFILPEVLFYQLDKRNRMSKGQSEKEAAAGALESGTLGAYDNKAYMEGLKETAESMGIDSQSFDSAYQLNLLSKSYNQNNANYEKNYMQLLEMGDEQRADDLKKNFDRYTKETQNNYKLLTNNIADNVMNTVGASPLIMKEGRENITQEQFEKPFYGLQDAALEKLKREKLKAFDTQKLQSDTAAGDIGNTLLSNVFNTQSLPRAGKFLFDLANPFSSLPKYKDYLSDAEKENQMLRSLEPSDLNLVNLARGFTRDNIKSANIESPILASDIENIRYENPGVFFAGGGIAKLAGVSSGVAPESGPNPQGLLSLKNRVRNY